MGFIFLFIYFILFSVDTEMHRWSSFYRKRSTTSFMYVCGRSVSCPQTTYYIDCFHSDV